MESLLCKLGFHKWTNWYLLRRIKEGMKGESKIRYCTRCRKEQIKNGR